MPSLLVALLWIIAASLLLPRSAAGASCYDSPSDGGAFVMPWWGGMCYSAVHHAIELCPRGTFLAQLRIQTQPLFSGSQYAMTGLSGVQGVCSDGTPLVQQGVLTNAVTTVSLPMATPSQLARMWARQSQGPWLLNALAGVGSSTNGAAVSVNCPLNMQLAGYQLGTGQENLNIPQTLVGSARFFCTLYDSEPDLADACFVPQVNDSFAGTQGCTPQTLVEGSCSQLPDPEFWQDSSYRWCPGLRDVRLTVMSVEPTVSDEQCSFQGRLPTRFYRLSYFFAWNRTRTAADPIDDPDAHHGAWTCSGRYDALTRSWTPGESCIRMYGSANGDFSMGPLTTGVRVVSTTGSAVLTFQLQTFGDSCNTVSVRMDADRSRCTEGLVTPTYHPQVVCNPPQAQLTSPSPIVLPWSQQLNRSSTHWLQGDSLGLDGVCRGLPLASVSLNYSTDALAAVAGDAANWTSVTMAPETVVLLAREDMNAQERAFNLTWIKATPFGQIASLNGAADGARDPAAAAASLSDVALSSVISNASLYADWLSPIQQGWLSVRCDNELGDAVEAVPVFVSPPSILLRSGPKLHLLLNASAADSPARADWFDVGGFHQLRLSTEALSLGAVLELRQVVVLLMAVEARAYDSANGQLQAKAAVRGECTWPANVGFVPDWPRAFNSSEVPFVPAGYLACLFPVASVRQSGAQVGMRAWVANTTAPAGLLRQLYPYTQVTSADQFSLLREIVWPETQRVRMAPQWKGPLTALVYATRNGTYGEGSPVPVHLTANDVGSAATASDSSSSSAHLSLVVQVAAYPDPTLRVQVAVLPMDKLADVVRIGTAAAVTLTSVLATAQWTDRSFTSSVSELDADGMYATATLQVQVPYAMLLSVHSNNRSASSLVGAPPAGAAAASDASVLVVRVLAENEYGASASMPVHQPFVQPCSSPFTHEPFDVLPFTLIQLGQQSEALESPLMLGADPRACFVCPEGKDCSSPSSPYAQPCPNQVGVQFVHCPLGSWSPVVCETGFACSAGLRSACPSGVTSEPGSPVCDQACASCGVGGTCISARYLAPLCVECSPGYFAFAGGCRTCASSVWPTVGVLIGVLILVVLLYKFFSADRLKYTTLRIVLNFAQIGALVMLVAVAWPESTRVVFDYIETVGGSIQVYHPACHFTAWTLYHQLTLGLAAPFVLLGVLGVGILFAVWNARRLSVVAVVHPEKVTAWKGNAAMLRRLQVLVLTLAYTPQAQLYLSLFRCTTNSGSLRRLAADTNLPCMDSMHKGMIALGAVLVVVHEVGIPLGIVYFLRRHRIALPTPVFIDRYGGLYELYSANLPWFDSVILIRKFLALVVLAATDSALAHGVVGLILTALYLVLLLWRAPFRRVVLSVGKHEVEIPNLMERAATVLLLFEYVVSIALEANPSLGPVLGGFTVAVHMFFIGVCALGVGLRVISQLWARGIHSHEQIDKREKTLAEKLPADDDGESKVPAGKRSLFCCSYRRRSSLRRINQVHPVSIIDNVDDARETEQQQQQQQQQQQRAVDANDAQDVQVPSQKEPGASPSPLPSRPGAPAVDSRVQTHPQRSFPTRVAIEDDKASSVSELYPGYNVVRHVVRQLRMGRESDALFEEHAALYGTLLAAVASGHFERAASQLWELTFKQLKWQERVNDFREMEERNATMQKQRAAAAGLAAAGTGGEKLIKATASTDATAAPEGASSNARLALYADLCDSLFPRTAPWNLLPRSEDVLRQWRGEVSALGVQLSREWLHSDFARKLEQLRRSTMAKHGVRDGWSKRATQWSELLQLYGTYRRTLHAYLTTLMEQRTRAIEELYFEVLDSIRAVLQQLLRDSGGPRALRRLRAQLAAEAARSGLPAHLPPQVDDDPDDVAAAPAAAAAGSPSAQLSPDERALAVVRTFDPSVRRANVLFPAFLSALCVEDWPRVHNGVPHAVPFAGLLVDWHRCVVSLRDKYLLLLLQQRDANGSDALLSIRDRAARYTDVLLKYRQLEEWLGELFAHAPPSLAAEDCQAWTEGMLRIVQLLLRPPADAVNLRVALLSLANACDRQCPCAHVSTKLVAYFYKQRAKLSTSALDAWVDHTMQHLLLLEYHALYSTEVPLAAKLHERRAEFILATARLQRTRQAAGGARTPPRLLSADECARKPAEASLAAAAEACAVAGAEVEASAEAPGGNDTDPLLQPEVQSRLSPPIASSPHAVAAASGALPRSAPPVVFGSPPAGAAQPAAHPYAGQGQMMYGTPHAAHAAQMLHTGGAAMQTMYAQGYGNGWAPQWAPQWGLQQQQQYYQQQQQQQQQYAQHAMYGAGYGYPAAAAPHYAGSMSSAYSHANAPAPVSSSAANTSFAPPLLPPVAWQVQPAAGWTPAAVGHAAAASLPPPPAYDQGHGRVVPVGSAAAAAAEHSHEHYMFAPAAKPPERGPSAFASPHQ